MISRQKTPTQLCHHHLRRRQTNPAQNRTRQVVPLVFIPRQKTPTQLCHHHRQRRQTNPAQNCTRQVVPLVFMCHKGNLNERRFQAQLPGPDS
jgi:hypothetical protein